MTTNARVDAAPQLFHQASEHTPPNVSELEVYKRLRQDGYHVLSRGWPDLLAVKMSDSSLFDAHWSVDDVRMIEVKSGNDTLSTYQKACLSILRTLGHQTEVARWNGDTVTCQQFDKYGRVDPTQQYTLREEFDQSYRNLCHSVADFRRKTASVVPAAYDDVSELGKELLALGGEVLSVRGNEEEALSRFVFDEYEDADEDEGVRGEGKP